MNKESTTYFPNNSNIFSFIYQHGDTGRFLEKVITIEVLMNKRFETNIDRYYLICIRKYIGKNDIDDKFLFDGDTVEIYDWSPEKNCLE